MVRDVIARQGGREPAIALPSPDLRATHASHARFVVLSSGDDDGACVIEPTIRCNHCGYCLSLGH